MTDAQPRSTLALALLGYSGFAALLLLLFLAYFCYQHWARFYSPTALTARHSLATGSGIKKLAKIGRNVGVLKIIATSFAAGSYLSDFCFFSLGTEISCIWGWKFTALFYVLAKFSVYVLLFQRGELVSVSKRTNFERVVQFSTLGVPVLGVTAFILGSGEHLQGVCALDIPYWLTVLMIILDFGLSVGYLIMFVLKLRKLDRNLKQCSVSRLKSDGSKKDSSRSRGASDVYEVDVKQQVELETPRIGSNRPSTNNEETGVINAGAVVPTGSTEPVEQPTQKEGMHKSASWCSGSTTSRLAHQNTLGPPTTSERTLAGSSSSSSPRGAAKRTSWDAGSSTPRSSPNIALVITAPLVLPAAGSTPSDAPIKTHGRVSSSSAGTRGLKAHHARSASVPVPVAQLPVPSPTAAETASRPSRASENGSTENSTIEPTPASAKQKRRKRYEEQTSYKKIMMTHTKITAVTCVSTILAMIFIVVAEGTDYEELRIASGPFANADLIVNIVAIGIMTRGLS